MKQFVPRRSDRFRYLCSIDVRSTNGSIDFRADVIDLGEWGLSMFAKRFLKVGTPVAIKFSNGRAMETESTHVVGHVARASVDIEGNILGVAFSRPLGDAELRTLTTLRDMASIL